MPRQSPRVSTGIPRFTLRAGGCIGGRDVYLLAGVVPCRVRMSTSDGTLHRHSQDAAIPGSGSALLPGIGVRL